MANENPSRGYTEITVEQAKQDLEARIDAFEPVEIEGTDGGRLFHELAKSALEHPQIFTDKYNEILRQQRELDAGF